MNDYFSLGTLIEEWQSIIVKALPSSPGDIPIAFYYTYFLQNYKIQSYCSSGHDEYTVGALLILSNEMIVMYGKGKVGEGVTKLLDILDIDHALMDDTDRDDTVLQTADQIIITPGIKPTHDVRQIYGDKVVSELTFLGQHRQRITTDRTIEVIGITGTNGKSTTTRILYHILQKLATDWKVYLVGNFGTPLSDTVADIIATHDSGKHLFVTEVSSFMLYELRGFSFDYGILLNIHRDHLDRHGTMEDYTQSKLNLLAHTTKASWTSPEIHEKLPSYVRGHIHTFDDAFDISQTQFAGRHSAMNFRVAQLCTERWLTDHGHIYEIQEFLRVANDIQPLAHRLQSLKQIDSIQIIDDSICTSADALRVALQAMYDNVVLICGGYDKGDDYTGLAPVFSQYVAHAVVMGQTADKMIAVCDETNIPFTIVDSQYAGLEKALQVAKENNITTILYSPGAASFDMFHNVYDRAEKFVALVDGH